MLRDLGRDHVAAAQVEAISACQSASAGWFPSRVPRGSRRRTRLDPAARSGWAGCGDGLRGRGLAVDDPPRNSRPERACGAAPLRLPDKAARPRLLAAIDQAAGQAKPHRARGLPARRRSRQALPAAAATTSGPKAGQRQAQGLLDPRDDQPQSGLLHSLERRRSAVIRPGKPRPSARTASSPGQATGRRPRSDPRESGTRPCRRRSRTPSRPRRSG